MRLLSPLIFFFLSPGTQGAATKKAKSEIMCEKYAESVFVDDNVELFVPNAPTPKYDSCGRIEQPLIVGGKKAAPREFPHMALLGYGTEQEVNWMCGGSLISEQYILTAAHCTNTDIGPAKWATLGDLKVLSDKDEAEPVTVDIVERINHPLYNPDHVYHDLALFKLKTPVKLSAYIRPICLHRDKSINSTIPIASGWGHTTWRGSPTQDLMKVDLPLVDAEKCNSSFKLGRKLNKGIDDATMICAGGQQGHDTCQGDSGGPLQYPLKTPYCMYSLIGVTSFGGECAAGKPGVYTRVSHYIDWIESIVWK